MNRSERINALKRAMEKRILVLSEAMGTTLQSFNLTAADFGGPELEGCNENLVRTKPDAVADVHRKFLAAGADIIITNTFGSTPLVLAEYGLAEHAYEISRLGAEIARNVATEFSNDQQLRFVAGSMGPTTKSLTVTGGVTFDELINHFYIQAKGLYDGGVDYFVVETAQDTRNIKTAILGIQKLFAETKEAIPIAVSGTVEPTGTLLAGQSVEALWASLAHLDLLYLGLNCATGPEFMTDHIRSLAQLSRFRVSCVPNAGLPDVDGNYLETPTMVGHAIERFAQSGWVNIVGGCCGTTPAHIQKLVELAKKYSPRVPTSQRTSFLSGVDYVELTDEQRPLLVGERTNVIGSRKFKKLICDDQFEAAAEIARGQVKHGAQVIDICLANPDRDEHADMEQFLQHAIKLIKAPMMIDSTDEKVIAMALTYCQGKSIINSINLEDGEERFEKVTPLARQMGAALVVGTIDDDPTQGMAVTRDRKLAVAERSYKLLTEKYGIAPEDIYFDPLVFPCATGDAQYVGSAVETIEGLRLIKKRFPECKTILGISNVSFGLPNAGREVLNSVFLYHCTKAGLDLAIVNSELLQRYPSISDQEKKLAEDLLWNRGADPIAAFAAHFRDSKPKTKKEGQKLPLDQRLANYIVEGTKEGLIDDLKLALKERKPLEVINGPLMIGMDEVGRLFNANELIVAEVLQSAEAMKAAVSFLEPFMEKSETASRGKVLLATVKGDVHDIGKNLVEIVLSNNGFEVINLGIKVPPDTLINAVREHSPHILGLSGLLVKSAQQMVITAEDLAKAGISVPILVGGAALSRAFTDRRIAKAYTGGTVAYASDAMNGLELAKVMMDPKKFQELKTDLEKRQTEAPVVNAPTESPIIEARSNIVPVTSPPPPPDFDRHVLTNTPVDQIWSYINPRMLLGRHLGIPNSMIHRIESNSPRSTDDTDEEKKAWEIVEKVDEVKAYCKQKNLLAPKAVYQFYRAQSDGETILMFPKEGSATLGTIRFPRQKKSPHLCIADYLNSNQSTVSDNLCMFVVTAGQGVREQAEKFKKAGEYLKSHILSALALETAEAYAELLHTKIRSMWGNPDPLNMTMLDRFQAKYEGRRYSFGYPACPNLESQAVLFDMLKPTEIGVELTDGFMMDPEASVSALVFHHPRATYFSA